MIEVSVVIVVDAGENVTDSELLEAIASRLHGMTLIASRNDHKSAVLVDVKAVAVRRS